MSSIASAPHGRPRRIYYVDPELQLPLVAALMLLVTSEALFVGFGFYKAIEIAQEWRRPHQALDFFGTLALVLVPTVVFNLAAGVVLSHRIAGPAEKIRQAMAEVARGNLDVKVSLRRSDLLQSWASGFNAMVESLRFSLERRRRRVLARDARALPRRVSGTPAPAPARARARP